LDEGLEVYVVDDSRDAADSLAALLSRMGHRASACYGGQDALALIRQARPDCVFLDIGMSGMDGLALARALREEFGDDIVLVAVTGEPKDSPRVAGTFEIVDHWFEKPVGLDELRSVLIA